MSISILQLHDLYHRIVSLVQGWTPLLTSPCPSFARRGDPQTARVLPLGKGELEGVLSLFLQSVRP